MNGAVRFLYEYGKQHGKYLAILYNLKGLIQVLFYKKSHFFGIVLEIRPNPAIVFFVKPLKEPNTPLCECDIACEADCRSVDPIRRKKCFYMEFA